MRFSYSLNVFDSDHAGMTSELGRWREVVVAVVGSVAGCAAGLEFSRHGVLGFVVGRVVVELEEVGGAAVDAFVVVSFHHDSFLACGWVASSVGGIDWSPVGVVEHESDEGVVELLDDGAFGDWGAVIERGAVTADVEDDFSRDRYVFAHEEEGEGVGALLGEGRDEGFVGAGVPPTLQFSQLTPHRAVGGGRVRGRVWLTLCGRTFHGA